MEKEYRVSWLKVFSVTLVIFIIIGVIFFIYPKSKNKDLTARNTYITNINLMKDAGFEYFQGSNLPEKIGSSYEMTLGEMIDSKLIMDFVDEKGKSCNLSDSYIKATKTLDNEYAMKVYLSCDSKTDYIVTSIANNVVCTNCNELAENISNPNNDANNEENYNQNYDKNDNYTGSSTTDKNSVNNYYYNYYYNNNNSTNNSNNTTTNNNCSTPDCYCNGKCESNIYYSVNFDSKGGSYVARQLVKANDTADYRISTRSGYEFLGWYLDGVKYDFNTPVTKRITLEAHWAPLNNTKYEVRFNPNNGENSTTTTVEDGNPVSRPKDPYLKCYRFLGWYLNGVKYDFSRPVYGNIVLEAKWEDDGTCKTPNKYTVDFNSTGGSSVASETVYEGNKAYRPNNPTKKCYSFVAWHLNSTNGPIYTFSTPVSNNITLYAEWEDDGSCNPNTYVVKFNSNGGSSVKSETVIEGNRATVPVNPTKNGYKFLGWTDKNGRNFNFNTRIYENITLYAEWEKEEVKYNKYCRITEERIYSTSYIAESTIKNKSRTSFSYTVSYQNKNAQNVSLKKYGNITNYSEYSNAFHYLRDGNLNLLGGNGDGIDPGSTSNLRDTSLKSYNFNPVVRYSYQRGNTYYFDITANLLNLNNIREASKYYVNTYYWIYYTPLYFDIEFTDLSDCVNDLASRSSSYRNYEIVDTYYR